MIIRVSPMTASLVTRHRIIENLETVDIYGLNTDFFIKYEVVLNRKTYKTGHHSIFIVISSLLICINEISEGRECEIVLEDSPPHIRMYPKAEKVYIGYDASENGGAERATSEDVLQALTIAATKCGRIVCQTGRISFSQVKKIIDQINPHMANLSRLLERF